MIPILGLYRAGKASPPGFFISPGRLIINAMHPATRILVFCVTAGFMVTGNPIVLAAGVISSLILHRAAGLRPDAGFVRMISRMRWFFLSMIILYAWFTPGVPLLEASAAYSPTQDGLLEGLLRCAVLIVILSLVHWLVGSTGREQLIEGIYWLARPTRCIGLEPERLALRLGLVLETVPAVQQRSELRLQGAQAAATRMQCIASHAAAILDNVLNEADRAALTDIEVVSGRRPQLSDWLILSALVGTLTTLIRLPL